MAKSGATSIGRGAAAWRIAVVGLTQGVIAWVMAFMGLVYPPIPMFLAALLAGVLYHGRPADAARGGLWAGVTLGWLAEWAYVSARLPLATATWDPATPWEGVGLAVAEILLYAALLSFFSAFISWGASSHVPARPEPSPAPPEPAPRARGTVPFNPHDEDASASPALPMFRSEPEPKPAPAPKPAPKPDPKQTPKA